MARIARWRKKSAHDRSRAQSRRGGNESVCSHSRRRNLSATSNARGQDGKLVEAAKKDGGKVVIYGSLETPVVEGVIQAFRKKTGLNAEYWRASAMSVMNRAMTEYRAGNPAYDIVLNNSDPLMIMANDGMLAKYDSPTAQKYPQGPDRCALRPNHTLWHCWNRVSQRLDQTGRRAQSDRGSRQSEIQRIAGHGRPDLARDDDPVVEQFA